MNEDLQNLKESLQRDLEELRKTWAESHKDIYTGLRTILSLRASMITHLALVAGALASFSFLIIGTSLVYGKTFLISAIIILLGVIGWSFYLLHRILHCEESQFTKLQEQYNELYPRKIEAIEKVMVDWNIEEYNKTIKEVNDKLTSLRQKEKESEEKRIFRLDRNISQKILIGASLIALLLVGLSFIRL